MSVRSVLPRALRRRLQFVLVGSLLAAMALGLLLGTGAGAELAVGVATGRMPGGATLSVDGLKGSLWRGIDADTVRYEAEGMEVLVQGLAFRWTPMRLVQGEVAIRRLGATAIAVTLPESEPPPPAPFAGLPDILLPRLPVQVALTELTVGELTLAIGDERHVLSDLTAGGYYGHDGAGITEATLTYTLSETATLSAALKAEAPIEAPLFGGLILDAEGAIAGLSEPVAFTLSLNADSSALPLRVHLGAPLVADLDLSIRGLGGNGAPGVKTPEALEIEGTLEHAAVPATLSGLSGDTGAGRLHMTGPLSALDIGYEGQLPFNDLEMPVALTGMLALALPATAELTWALPAAGPLSGLAGALRLTRDDAGTLVAGLEVGSPWALAATLRMDSPDFANATIQGEVTAKDWPVFLTAEREWSLTSAEVSLAGTLNALRAEADVAAQLAPTGPVSLALLARLDHDTVLFDALTLGLLDGELKAAGELGLAPDLPVRAEISAKGLDLGALRTDATTFESRASLPPKLPQTRVDLDLGLDIHREGEAILGEVDVRALRGRWLDQPLAANGRVVLASDVIDLPEIRATLGANQLQGTARLGETLSARGEVGITDFTQLDPTWRGNLVGDFALAGTLDAPRLDARFKGEQMQVAGIRVDRLASDVKVDLTPAAADGRPVAESNGQISLQGLEFSGGRYRSLELTAAGTREAHRLELRLTPENTPANTPAANTPAAQTPRDWVAQWSLPAARGTLEGGLDTENTWRGRIAALGVNDSLMGSWDLTDPAALAWGSDPAARYLKPLCLVREPAELCVSMQGIGADGRVDMSVSSLPLSWIEPWLTPARDDDYNFNGSLNAAVGVAQRGDAFALPALSGQARVALSGAGATVPALYGDAPIDVALSEATAELTLSADRIRLAASVADPGMAALSLAVSAPRADEGPALLAMDGPLQGTLAADVPALGRLAPVLPALEGILGSITLAAEVSGTVAAPAVTLDLAGPTFEFPIPAAGISLKAPTLAASTDRDQQLYFDGSVQSSAGGALTVNGNIPAAALIGRLTGADGALAQGTPPDDPAEWPLTLSLSGDAVTVAQLSDLEAAISPALTLRSDLNRGLDVRGSLHVPNFNLELGQVPQGTSSVNRDQVIVDAEGVPEASSDTNEPFSLKGVRGSVDVTLGDAVMFSAFGLTTRLTGALNVSREADADTVALASGRVSMKEGHFEAYGQPLKITSGEFMFAGPVDNPAISLRAVRPDISIEAGVAVTGTVRSPRLNLFSSPAQDEANTLAYVITGRPLSSASKSNASMLLRAAQSLGMEQADAASKRLKDTLSLDELAVDADFEDDGQLESSSLVMGKQITDQIGLRTELDLFDRLWSFFITYRLNKNWSLEAESGKRNAAGVVYAFDREKLFDIQWPWQRAAAGGGAGAAGRVATEGAAPDNNEASD